MHMIDIYSIPKKLLIRVLVEYTKNTHEKEYLLKLCSKEGCDLYEKTFLEENVTFLSLILQLESCRPPVERLLEHLPKLLPRPYSIASSPLNSCNKIEIIFSLLELCNDQKEGLCTGMLKNKINNYNKEEKKTNVKLYFRKSNGFNLPDTEVPLILIATGTGIAPFLGKSSI